MLSEHFVHISSANVLEFLYSEELLLAHITQMYKNMFLGKDSNRKPGELLFALNL